MVNFYPSFVDEKWRKLWKSTERERDALRETVEAEYRERREPVPYSVQMQVDRDYYAQHPEMKLPGIEAVVEHIDYVAQVAGIDHVGLGSDFDGVEGQLPEGIDSVADLPKITAALMERGYSAEDCRKILGGNLLRVFREVQAVAKQLQAENRPRIGEKQPFEKSRD